ncbi:hypothetical protein J2T09_000870 [Neorhizobium huautlense]|uniref:Uncharacterized protein n=1 Tax=Neorhizobium huautlense TaxID=67774 RepID=A0ABT9PNT0_9HYPH|nr:hypothetical protein [Neorhizobium huautlense]MDP9836128.1 hypothetical protein [Neorhizobium huautlense]
MNTSERSRGAPIIGGFPVMADAYPHNAWPAEKTAGQQATDLTIACLPLFDQKF